MTEHPKAADVVTVPLDLLDKAAYALSSTVLGSQLFAALAASPVQPSRSERLLEQCLEAIETGRSEPLFIIRDAIRNHIEDRAHDQG